MKLTRTHYVPLLQCRAGEADAILSLEASLAPRVVPIVELLAEPPDDAPDRWFSGQVRIWRAISDRRPSYVDTRNLTEDRAQIVLDTAIRLGHVAVPVFSLSAAAVDVRWPAIALRVTFEDIKNRDDVLGAALEACRRHGVSPENADIIGDMGIMSGMVPDGATKRARGFVEELGSGNWRNFVLLGCAFPPSGALGADQVGVFPRLDWYAWTTLLPGVSPTFGDGGVQYAGHTQGYDKKKGMQVSANIRHTTDSEWVLLKGHVANKQAQYPALARSLTRSGNPRYSGDEHCSACRELGRVADGHLHLGANSPPWRRIGQLHHFVTVLSQLQSHAS